MPKTLQPTGKIYIMWLQKLLSNMWPVVLVILIISLLYKPIWWNRLYSGARLLLAFIYFHTFYKAPTQNRIVRYRQELNKIPKHAAFIFNESSFRPSSLAQLLTWFSCLGVETVTFYSQHGVDEMVICTICNSLRKSFNGKVGQNRNKITLEMSEHSKADDSIGRKAGKLEVIFIDKSYGKSMITKLATRAISKSADEELLTVDEFQREMVKEAEFSPPELALIFGPTFSTCGYPPWHLQFTEMHYFLSHKYLQWGQVRDVLKTFADTKQNYGK